MKIYGKEHTNAHCFSGNKSSLDSLCNCGHCKKAPGPGGDIHNTRRNSAAKRTERRAAKRAARRVGKAACARCDN